MFNLFKRKPFKWPDNPKGTYLEQEYWNSESIGYQPNFPIVVIDFNDGGSIEVYKGFGDIEVRWNHFLFENHINETYPTYIIDSEMTLSKLQFHKNNFNYPEPEGKIDKIGILRYLKKCELSNYSDFENTEKVEEIFQKLMNREHRYDYE